MTRLQLSEVSLCAVDTRAPELAAQSLHQSMAGVDFGRVVLFTRDGVAESLRSDIEVVVIDPITSGADYSRFVMRHLLDHIHGSHVLITQWDGFVTHPGAWNPAFLECDYIGAVWPEQPEGMNVGNGGFSLRSRRFLQAGRDARIVQEHPEDEVLCRQHRSLLEQKHGIRFAPTALARQFAFENETAAAPTFGFHGPYNLPRVLDEPTLLAWLPQLPDVFFRSRDARRLARAMLAHRMPAAATELLRRRRAAGRRDNNTRALGWLASAQALVTARPTPKPKPDPDPDPNPDPDSEPKPKPKPEPEPKP